VIKRILKRQLSGCLFKWIEVVEETKRLRSVCQRVGARWLKAGLVATIQKWIGFVEQRIYDRNIVRKWLASAENRELSSAVRTWKTFVRHFERHQQQSELNALKEQYEAMVAASQQQRMKRVIERFRQRRLSSALAGWKDFISLRRRYRRFAKKLFQHKLIAVFNRWNTYVEETLRMKRVGQKVVARMLQRRVSSSFETWSLMAKENKRLR
jgi:ribosomal protein S20